MKKLSYCLLIDKTPSITMGVVTAAHNAAAVTIKDIIIINCIIY